MSFNIAPGVEIREYASGKKSIRLQFMYRGVQCTETATGLNGDKKNHVKHAIHWRETIVHQIAMGSFNYLEHFPDSNRARLFGFVVSKRTVKNVAESWLAEVERSLPHSTYRSYRGPCERFIYPAIGQLRIRDVTVEHLRSMFREADISLKTARNYSIPMRAIFQRAIDDDDIDRNPMERINVKSLIPKERHSTEYDADPFTPAEVEAILRALREWRPDWLNYFTLAFFTGIRPSELYGLEWRDIDLQGRTLRVERSVVERQVKAPKTRASRRTVLLDDRALAALKRQREKTALAGGRVFLNPRNGEDLADYQVSERALDYCQKKAGIRRRNQYQTRHTYASTMLSQGANPMFIAKQLGHNGLEMLFRVYGRWVAIEGDHAPSYGERDRGE